MCADVNIARWCLCVASVDPILILTGGVMCPLFVGVRFRAWVPTHLPTRYHELRRVVVFECFVELPGDRRLDTEGAELRKFTL